MCKLNIQFPSFRWPFSLTMLAHVVGDWFFNVPAFVLLLLFRQLLMRVTHSFERTKLYNKWILLWLFLFCVILKELCENRFSSQCELRYSHHIVQITAHANHMCMLPLYTNTSFVFQNILYIGKCSSEWCGKWTTYTLYICRYIMAL